MQISVADKDYANVERDFVMKTFEDISTEEEKTLFNTRSSPSFIMPDNPIQYS